MFTSQNGHWKLVCGRTVTYALLSPVDEYVNFCPTFQKSETSALANIKKKKREQKIETRIRLLGENVLEEYLGLYTPWRIFSVPPPRYIWGMNGVPLVGYGW